jgi:hypothetical protein
VAGKQAHRRTVPHPGGNGTGGPAVRTYRYRGAPKPDPDAARAAELLTLLAQQRKTIALRSSRVRALASDLNDHIAQAVCDGVKAAAIAEVSGLPAATVRTTALAREDPYPSGLSRAEHLRRLQVLAAELAAAEEARTAVEQSRAQHLAKARKLRLLDDYQLASATGLKHEEIRKLTRGIAAL